MNVSRWEQNTMGKQKREIVFLSKSSKVMVKKICVIVYLWRLYLPIYLTFLFFLPSRTTLSSLLFVILSLPFCLKYFQPPSSFSSTFSCPHLVKSVVCHWSYNTWLFLNISRHTNTNTNIHTHKHPHTHTYTHTYTHKMRHLKECIRRA